MSRPSFPNRSSCPLCTGRDLFVAVGFDAVPVLCNALHPHRPSALDAATGPFSLAFCEGCGHLFNQAFDAARIGYTQDYENSLHYSAKFEAFAQELCERLTRTYGLAGKTVVDIGCGKGDFLKRLCALSGASGVGFDRSYEDARGQQLPNVRFVNDWFSNDYPDVEPALVCCRHVLEHIPEPLAFLRSLRRHPGVGAGTVFYFEVPNALYTLRDLGIWDLIYEHVSYFTPVSLRAALRLAGFEIRDSGASFGDQYLYVEAIPAGDEPAEVSPDVSGVKPLVAGFEAAYTEKLKHWGRFMAAHEPDQVAIWGAGSKGITFVNVVPGAGGVHALVDVNPHKHGRFAPGTGTPVVAPEALRGQHIRAIVIMNALYRDEISKSVADLGLLAEIVVA